MVILLFLIGAIICCAIGGMAISRFQEAIEESEEDLIQLEYLYCSDNYPEWQQCNKEAIIHMQSIKVKGLQYKLNPKYKN